MESLAVKSMWYLYDWYHLPASLNGHMKPQKGEERSPSAHRVLWLAQRDKQGAVSDLFLNCMKSLLLLPIFSPAFKSMLLNIPTSSFCLYVLALRNGLERHS